jgi:putative addiction module CopG family antidote
MDITIPGGFQQFVEHEIASGRFRDASQVVSEALRLLEWKRRHDALRDEIRIGMEEAQRGEIAPLDLDEIRADVRRRTASRDDRDTYPRQEPR